MTPPQIDEARALHHLMDLLAIEGLSGREGKVAATVREKLLRRRLRTVPDRAR